MTTKPPKQRGVDNQGKAAADPAEVVETGRGSDKPLPTSTPWRFTNVPADVLLDAAIKLGPAAADLPRRSAMEKLPPEMMAAAAELLGFRDELPKPPDQEARDLQKIVRAVGARPDVIFRAGELRRASRAADKVVGKPGPQLGQSAPSCEDIKTEYKRWRNDKRVKDRRQSAFAERLKVSVSTLQRRLRGCGLQLVFARSRKAPK